MTSRLRLRKALRLVDVAARNRWSRSSATTTDGPVVSMTSYGRRISTVHLALESIAAGTMRPSRLILWLDDAEAVARPTPGLKRLVGRGLELRHCEDDGPHKKYYPYVQSLREHTVPLVTADDDWLFPARWLETLMAFHRTDPTTNTTHRARDIAVRTGEITRYEGWGLASRRAASPRNLATGGWGHVMVPAMLEGLRDRHAEFRRAAPRADDIWLHRVAIETGTSPKVVGLYDHHQILHMPIGGGPTLAADNVDDGGNDRQIAAAWPRAITDCIIGDQRSRPTTK